MTNTINRMVKALFFGLFGLFFCSLSGQTIPFVINGDGQDYAGNFTISTKGLIMLDNGHYTFTNPEDVLVTVKTYVPNIGLFFQANCTMHIEGAGGLISQNGFNYQVKSPQETIHFFLKDNFQSNFIRINLSFAKKCNFKLVNPPYQKTFIFQSNTPATEITAPVKTPIAVTTPRITKPKADREKDNTSVKDEKEEEEEKAWKMAKKANTDMAYISYLDKYPAGKYKWEARQLIPISITVNKEETSDNIYTYILKNLASREKPTFETLDSLIQLEELKRIKNGWKIRLHQIQGLGGSSKFSICDPDKIEKYRCQEIELGNNLNFEWVKSDSTLFGLLLSKGSPPYTLEFFNTTISAIPRRFSLNKDAPPVYWSVQQQGTEGELWTISLKELSHDLGSGTYRIIARDGGPVKISVTEVFVVKHDDLPIKWIIASILGILLISILLSARRRHKRKKAQAIRDKRKAEKSIPMEEETSDSSVPITENEQELTDEENTSALDIKAISVGAPKLSGGFTIEHRKNKHTKAAFAYSEASTDFLELQMSDLWEDSVLKSIYLHRDTIYDLDRFLRTYNITKIQEKEGSIPEIGGMLMGSFQEKNGEFKVTIDKFIPIQSKFENVYQLEFSADSISKDLGMIQDEHPDLVLVGWFHTHPGHGLFLSKPDLGIQKGFFTKLYQFAMEIDSLSENLDTGFFTWKKNKEINNTERHIKDFKWYSWSEIEKFTRKR